MAEEDHIRRYCGLFGNTGMQAATSQNLADCYDLQDGKTEKL
jgi:hypothetical protein